MTVRLLGLLLGALAFANVAQAQTGQVTPLDHLPALKGDYFRLDSATLGRPLHIYIRLPADYWERPAERYPVVYLLDGDSAFPILAPTHLFLTYDEQLPEAIVVGIAYGGFGEVNRRGVDFMSPAPGVAPEEAGAPAFHRFLTDELLPQVERRTRADPARRILVGQSRGGSFVLYSAFTDPDLFWGRIASNPSFSRDGENWFGDPAAATWPGLRLIVASGSRDRAQLRADALRWWEVWRDREDRPWLLRFLTIQGGTHAANLTDAYRAGMLEIFGPRRIVD